MRKLRAALACVAACVLSALAADGIGAAAAATPNYQGIWWGAPAGAEAGWGVSLAHQGDTILATWFTYGPDGRPLWFSIAAQRTAAATFAGDVYTGTGPAFGTTPFDPTRVEPAKAGSATFAFAGDSDATFAYTVNGVGGTKSLTREVFADPQPTCGADPQADPASATNFQDMWWAAPAGAEPGWGINLAHQGDTIFATWFTYGADGKPWWLVVAATRSAPNVYSGTLYTGTGPSFAAQPFDPALVEPTAVGTATFTFADGANATFAYVVNGVAGSKQITREVFGTASTVCAAPASAADRRRDAARFLRQATFGASREDIDQLLVQGYDAWLADQFAKPSTSHLATVQADPLRFEQPWAVTLPSLWKQFFEGPDQLRQRVSFALSQLFVVSLNNDAVLNAHCAAAAYLDVLNRDAFGNVRDLLRDITLNPAMGEYLSMRGSAKADPVLKAQPDENYAREVMQLFSIGTVMLNADGTVRHDAGGAPIPAYTEETVQHFARALSGWNFAGQNQAQPWRWPYPDIYDADPVLRAQKACAAWSAPMEPWMGSYWSADDSRVIAGPAHDANAKTLLAYPGAPHATLPAGQSPRADLEGLIDNLFNHPNVGPFLAYRLIQRLVTSNPSPGYVGRVAAAFADNGRGVRGDMKAVLRAILLDDEARSLLRAAQPSFGKLSEPVIRFVQLHRAFHATRANGYYDLWNFSPPTLLGQEPLRSPTVFNFFSPDYAPVGPVAQADLVAPEFEITHAASVAGFADFSQYGMILGFDFYNPDPGRRILPDHSYYLSLAETPDRLVDELDIVLCAGGLSPAFRERLVQSLHKVTDPDPAKQREDRVGVALWLIVNSPDYLVQK